MFGYLKETQLSFSYVRDLKFELLFRTFFVNPGSQELRYKGFQLSTHGK